MVWEEAASGCVTLLSQMVVCLSPARPFCSTNVPQSFLFPPKNGNVVFGRESSGGDADAASICL